MNVIKKSHAISITQNCKPFYCEIYSYILSEIKRIVKQSKKSKEMNMWQVKNKKIQRFYSIQLIS